MPKNLGMHFALIDKRRFAPNQVEINHLIGKLENMDVLIIDDMIDTAGTLVNAANAAIAKECKVSYGYCYTWCFIRSSN